MAEEHILKELTKDKSGLISSLNDLYVYIHLLLKEDSPKKMNKNTYPTYLCFENNRNINVNKNEVLSTLSNSVDSSGYFFNRKKRKFLDLINRQIESNTESTPKRPKRDDSEWLLFVKNQCGKHH